MKQYFGIIAVLVLIFMAWTVQAVPLSSIDTNAHNFRPTFNGVSLSRQLVGVNFDFTYNYYKINGSEATPSREKMSVLVFLNDFSTLTTSEIVDKVVGIFTNHLNLKRSELRQRQLESLLLTDWNSLIDVRNVGQPIGVSN